MKVLVTGASGFLGSRLVGSLRKKNHEVVGLARRRPLDWAGDFIEIDLGSSFDCSGSLKTVDAVVHLASRVHQGNETSTDLLPLYRRQITEATLRLAEQAKAAGVRKFVFMSSVKAVGEGSNLDYSDSTVPAPADPYGQSKFEAEQALRKLEDANFSIAILRPPLIYGPGVKANFLQLLKLVKRGVPLPLASVANRRSLVFVGNVVDAIERCLEFARTESIPFFISDREVVSSADLIRSIARAMGKKPHLIPFPLGLLKTLGLVTCQSGKIRRLTESLVVDSSGFRRAFKWEPPYTQEQGIRETVSWYSGAKS